jgi:NAD(P)H-dependent flavin oxidoreductase YrpB (nitropropane dioxygenase family)
VNKTDWPGARALLKKRTVLLTLEKHPMSSWPDTRILDLLGIELPIIQAPMAGATTAAMVIAANQAGALGSMPAAALSVEQLREALTSIRQAGSQPQREFLLPPATRG